MTHDFSHAAMHRLTDWPVLARIAARQTTAKRLDSRAVAALYARASEADRSEMNDAEREFADAALAAQSPILALQLHALRKLQALAKADGFKHLPDEKAFMDELSGEDNGIEVIIRVGRSFRIRTDATPRTCHRDPHAVRYHLARR